MNEVAKMIDLESKGFNEYNKFMRKINGWMDKEQTLDQLSANMVKEYGKLTMGVDKKVFFQAIMYVCNVRSAVKQKKDIMGDVKDLVGIMKDKFKNLPG